MRKLTYEEIKYYIDGENGNDCKLLTAKNNYIDTHHKLDVKCKCGNLFNVDYHRFKSKSQKQCNECSIKKSVEKTKKDFSVVYELFIKRGLVPKFNKKDYVNAKTNLSYLCLKHYHKGIQNITYDNLNSGEGCRYCGIESRANKKRHKIDDVYKIFKNNGLIPLFNNKDYKNAQSNLLYICPKHPDKPQKITYSNLQQSQGCRLCAIDKRASEKRKDGNIVVQLFIKNNMKPLFKAKDYINSNQKLPYLCNIHKELGVQYTTYAYVRSGRSCPTCGKDKITGENNYNYKGGISPLQNYMRDKITQWKLDSAKEYNFKCVITGENFDVIHHLYSFPNILKETLDELNYPIYSQVNKYTKNQLDLILEKIIINHYKYGLGVLLTENIHLLYHSNYGRGDNTPEQFEEFVQRYYSGEFDNSFNQDNKSVII